MSDLNLFCIRAYRNHNFKMTFKNSKELRVELMISYQFRKSIIRYERIGYNFNVLRQSVCLDFNPISVCFPLLLHTGGSGVRLYYDTDLKLIILVGWGRSCVVCCSTHRSPIGDSLLFRFLVVLFD